VANIYGTDEDIQNQINILFTAIPPKLGKTSTVNFGLLIAEIWFGIIPTQIDFVGRPYFGP